jgi:hypothetical protein
VRVTWLLAATMALLVERHVHFIQKLEQVSARP